MLYTALWHTVIVLGEVLSKYIICMAGNVEACRPEEHFPRCSRHVAETVGISKPCPRRRFGEGKGDDLTRCDQVDDRPKAVSGTNFELRDLRDQRSIQAPSSIMRWPIYHSILYRSSVPAVGLRVAGLRFIPDPAPKQTIEGLYHSMQVTTAFRATVGGRFRVLGKGLSFNATPLSANRLLNHDYRHEVSRDLADPGRFPGPLYRVLRWSLHPVSAIDQVVRGADMSNW